MLDRLDRIHTHAWNYAASRPWMRPVAPSISNSAELREQLTVAARSQMQHGATPAQIDRIVELAEQAGDFDVLSGGKLTRAEASRIIREMERGR